MEYNRAKNKIKKLGISLILLLIFVGINTFAANHNSKVLPPSNLESTYYVDTPETLVNEEYEQSLCLYTSGKCMVQTTEGVGYGTYDLTSGGLIKIQWDNGYEQEGTYTKITDVKNRTRIKSVRVNGVTYTNSERFVVNRPR